MPNLVVTGAMLRCSQGAAPSTLTVTSNTASSAGEKPAATVDDYQPFANIAPFGVCRAMANPQVAAATSAANGVLTPQPCVPVTTAPWSPGASIVTIDGKKALTVGATCSCSWTGTIEITEAGSTVSAD